jgi:hypothetical protein
MRYRYSTPTAVVRLSGEAGKIIDLANCLHQLLPPYSRGRACYCYNGSPSLPRPPEYRQLSRMTQQQHHHRNRDRTAVSLLTAGDTGKGCDRYE